MRRFEKLETNNNCTWEDVYNPIYNSLKEAFIVYDDKGVFFKSSANDFKENFVQDYWREDENLGEHIHTGFCVFPYNEKNWKEFVGFFNAAMDEIKEDAEADYIREATDDCEVDKDFTTAEDFATGETAGYYFDNGNIRTYKIRSYDSHIGIAGDEYVLVEYNSETDEYKTL